MRVLLIEDSATLTDAVRAGLRKLGYGVDAAADGEAGLSYARLNPYDVIILDLMLPKRHGLEVLRTLRAEGCATPILILTAMDAIEDRVTGLRAGSDDYLVKPFAFDELVARVEALLRRRSGDVHPVIEIDDLRIDGSARTVTRGGRPLRLTRREYVLLTYLAARRGEIVSRIEIEDHLYDEHSFPMSNVVASTVCSLRAHLAASGGRELIHTRRGLGYVLDATS